MEILILVVAGVLVVAIGLVFVGSAVGKTAAMPDQIVVDMHEAIDFCAEALPDEVTAELSYDDLRRLLRLHLEWIQAFHWAPEGSGEGPIVFEEYDALGYVMERADITGLNVSSRNAAAAIEAHSAYLQVVGAIHLEDPVQVEQDLAELPLAADLPRAELSGVDGESVEPDDGPDPER